MARVAVKNFEGNNVEELELSPQIFEIKVNDELVHQVYTVQAANQRETIAHTKNRGERSGSGIKPWRQKGTGRARVGSIRTPIWRKGGVVFGPTRERNFKKKINVKMKRLANKMVLSGKLADETLVVVENFDLKQVKTKQMAKLLSNLKIKGSVLMAFSKAEKDKMRASRNLPKTQNILVENLNVLDMLNRKYLIISKEGIRFIQELYSKNK